MCTIERREKGVAACVPKAAAFLHMVQNSKIAIFGIVARMNKIRNKCSLSRTARPKREKGEIYEVGVTTTPSLITFLYICCVGDTTHATPIPKHVK